jgi:hypothetical protein
VNLANCAYKEYAKSAIADLNWIAVTNRSAKITTARPAQMTENVVWADCASLELVKKPIVAKIPNVYLA